MLTISVIVPNYNHAAYLQQRIDSILEQGFQDFELILLDDCSTDDSRKVLEQYRDNPHVTHIVYNTKNSGSPFHQWTKGVSLAQGEWVWIAESDDWAEPQLLDTLLAAAERHPSCGLVYGMARYMRNGKEAWPIPVTGDEHAYNGAAFAREKLLYSNVIYNVSMTLMRRELLLQAEMESLGSLRLCGDWMLYARLCARTDVLEVSLIVSNYRMHDSNISSKVCAEGIAMIEDITVLEYIVKQFHVPLYRYVRYWGRKWMKQWRDLHINRDAQRRVRRRIAPRHPLIYAFYLIYRLKNCWIQHRAVCQK